MFSFFKRKKSDPDQKPDNDVDIQPAEEIAGEAGVPQEPAPEALAEAFGQASDGDAAVDTGAGEDVPDEAVDAAIAVAAGEPVAESALPEADAPVIEEPQPVVAPAVNAAPQQETAGHTQEKPGGSWLARLRKGLARTGQSIGGLFVGVKVDESLFEELETALLMADAGVEATESLLAALRARVKKDRLEDASQVREALRDILAQHLAPLEKPFPLDAAKPLIVMIAGVNGAGKTTSIGKLAHAFQAQGASVLLAAGDTFRAAAREQLIEWGARNDVTVIAQEGADPAAVAFDAVNAGRARGAHVVMVDTAGRLPTQLHLMEELKKIRRVIGKAQGDAPHEVLLVIDGNTGQNVLSQIRAFDAAIQLTGLVVTKLDGTAKGGTLAAVAAGSQGVRPVPVYWIGVGEGMHDLQPFVAREFAQALIGD
ncbi:signal recognition particle-docking protein FtsY [Paracandidimonas soli]|uniref:signal recognition particle-docking protein FtsY n=1 Tax=Paracandidimonas soli TaxID=1917182 RepID=UPI0033421742